MTKYELSLTPEYVPSWTIVDAMRELFQNALDQETTVPDNTMFWEYHEDIQSFHIGNKLSVLEPRTLLLGSSTKTNDDSTIGKFGEGYKIAALVLTRLGKKVTFFNYGAREVWRFRFSKSRKYGTDILVCEVDKKFPWAAVPNNNLTIVVEGVTVEESYEIGNSNLHMQEALGFWQTEKGRILLDEDTKGMMFVNGLYICTEKDFHYGYDFKPDQVKLDRDRKLIPNFELKWTTSQMWASLEDEDENWNYDTIDAAGRLIEKNAPDVAFFRSANSWLKPKRYDVIVDHTYESFKHDHGENAVPVSTDYELNNVPATHKPVLVNEGYKEVIKSSPKYSEPAPIKRASLRDAIEDWLELYGEHLPDGAVERLDKIVEEFE